MPKGDLNSSAGTLSSESENLSDADIASHRRWYERTRPIYVSLAQTVAETIERLLQQQGIDFLSVTHRAKEVESYIEKVKRKSYDDPRKQTTDLAGIRILTYIETDIARVGNIIRDTFSVHDDKSLDKTEELGVDRFGYRSVHFVCDLGLIRAGLPEYNRLAGLIFEVQVRTVIQHAWAEIEHDRSYKFPETLPGRFRRRLNLLAGMLEIADREFAALADDIDRYAQEISLKAAKGDLSTEINATSLLEYLRIKCANSGIELQDIENNRFLDMAVNELHQFGRKDLAEVDELVNDVFLKAFREHWVEDKSGPGSVVTSSGLIRTAMLFEDAERYLSTVKGRAWRLLPRRARNVLSEKYDEQEVDHLLEKYAPEES